jgi:predicted acetyltransferase
VELRWPSPTELPSYIAALERGWSANTMDDTAGRRELEQIRRDPTAFLDTLVDLDASAGPVVLPDGSTAERIPGYRRWIWDGEFCGSIGLRWQPGTEELPPHVLGHIGYAVVPWKRRQGYATEALRLLLPEAAARGLRYVEITTDTDNVASQRVIEANGGVLVEHFQYLPAYGAGTALRYRVDVVPGTS